MACAAANKVQKALQQVIPTTPCTHAAASQGTFTPTDVLVERIKDVLTITSSRVPPPASCSHHNNPSCVLYAPLPSPPLPVLLLGLQGLRVYEQGRLLAAWQDRLSDAVQAQLTALFNSACTHFLRLADVWVRLGLSAVVCHHTHEQPPIKTLVC